MESVLSQTFKDFEYIIIDDISIDGSKELIKKYADKLTYWASEKMVFIIPLIKELKDFYHTNI